MFVLAATCRLLLYMSASGMKDKHVFWKQFTAWTAKGDHIVRNAKRLKLQAMLYRYNRKENRHATLKGWPLSARTRLT